MTMAPHDIEPLEASGIGDCGPTRAEARGRCLQAAREQLASCGPRSLSDAQVLALVLGGSGTGGRAGPADALSRAEALIAGAGSLAALLGRELQPLTKEYGLSRTLAVRILATRELGRRYMAAPATTPKALARPEEAARCFRARLGDLPHEEFACLFLDSRHGLIRFESLFRGTIDGAAVYPREVVKRALYLNAAAVIAGHNHPSGSVEPSEADRSITAKLSKALGLIDIRLLDHLIVSRHGHTSLAEKGWL